MSAAVADYVLSSSGQLYGREVTYLAVHVVAAMVAVVGYYETGGYDGSGLGPVNGSGEGALSGVAGVRVW